MTFASRKIRLVAKIIDYCVMMISIILTHYIAGRDGSAFVFLIFLIVQAALLSIKGQTIGKWLVKIEIREFHAPIPNPGFFRNVFLRAILNLLLCLIPIYYFVDLLFIFRSDYRCLHDHIAGTSVYAVD